jgi:hypothetical protein
MVIMQVKIEKWNLLVCSSVRKLSESFEPDGFAKDGEPTCIEEHQGDRVFSWSMHEEKVGRRHLCTETAGEGVRKWAFIQTKDGLHLSKG